MKKAVIAALAALNVGLLVWVLTMHSEPAHAQVRGGSDYLQVSGRVGQNSEAIYILDLKTRNLKAWYYSTSDRKLVELRGRDIEADFKRGR
ncbi:MAG: hypothetical protein FWE88_04090 [Phycisphaerae bacterium]|nr:hypothetical protein [Phycisphaerae bacterium]